jgi:hypothetical protein
MHDFKIRYRDGRAQTVKADRTTPGGQFFVFERGGENVLYVAAADVESVGHADIEDPAGTARFVRS